MLVRRWCAVVVVIVLSGVPREVGAQSQETCATGIPGNIDAGVLERDAIALASSSETFRSQCDRVGHAARVRVTVAIVASLASGRAQTTIHRFRSGTIRADVVILFGENYRELLGHEFEHILEQLDGVDLRHEAAEGRAWVLPSGAFETRRAWVAGVQVLREVEPLYVHKTASAAVRATR